MTRKIRSYIFLLCSCISLSFYGCIKDKDYQFKNVSQQELADVTISYSQDSLPADGSSTSVITFHIAPKNNTDSINLSLLGLSINTSNGNFVESSNATLAITPTYKLDSATKERILTGTATLQSSTKANPALLTIKYLGLQVIDTLDFYRVNPIRITLTPSTLLLAPDFGREDTLTTQMASATGLPSQGTPVSINAYDSLYRHKMGVFRVATGKTNAAGGSTFIFVLGDSTVNGVNYTGRVHLVAYWTPNPAAVADTVDVYSRNQ